MMFTMNVDHGKDDSALREVNSETMYRNTEPIAPPNPMAIKDLMVYFFSKLTNVFFFILQEQLHSAPFNIVTAIRCKYSLRSVFSAAIGAKK